MQVCNLIVSVKNFVFVFIYFLMPFITSGSHAFCCLVAIYTRSVFCQRGKIKSSNPDVQGVFQLAGGGGCETPSRTG